MKLEEFIPGLRVFVLVEGNVKLYGRVTRLWSADKMETIVQLDDGGVVYINTQGITSVFTLEPSN